MMIKLCSLVATKRNTGISPLFSLPGGDDIKLVTIYPTKCGCENAEVAQFESNTNYKMGS